MAQHVARAVAWCQRHAAGYGADLRRLYRMGHSSGALQVQALLYAEPIYLQAERSPMPELRLVVLALQDRLAYGPTFEVALNALFGNGTSTLAGPWCWPRWVTMREPSPTMMRSSVCDQARPPATSTVHEAGVGAAPAGGAGGSGCGVTSSGSSIVRTGPV